MERLDYRKDFERNLSNLSEREKKIVEDPSLMSEPEAERMIERLKGLGFVRCPGGLVAMGLDRGLRCTIEGNRQNEVPEREYEIEPFFISKITVTNKEYEKFDERHSRTPTSQGNKHPVTCVSYGRAISYLLWLNEKTGMNFSLPTEPQIVKASAPKGWRYPYKEDGAPVRKAENVYRSYPGLYPEEVLSSTLEVDDPRVEQNYLGLHHATGNVSVFTLGHYRAEGHWGASSDGAYTVVFGGNFRTCPFGSRTVSRGIVDVSAVVDTIGIRLVHPDPANYVG